MPFLLMLWGGAQKAFGAVLEFCSKPPGSWIAAALAACLGLWWFGQHEFNAGVAKCEAAHAEAAAQEHAREITAVDAANTRSVDRTSKSEAVNTQNKVIIRVIHDQAAAMPDASDVCLSADVADGLRSLN